MLESEVEEPTNVWTCECGAEVERWRGQGDVRCMNCGAWYNPFGQRLRDDWMGNTSFYDDEVSDLDGFEEQQLRKEEPRETPTPV